MQPMATFAGEYLHDDLFLMAAAHLFHLAKNHPFLDANKRAALVTAITFLRLNGPGRGRSRLNPLRCDDGRRQGPDGQGGARGGSPRSGVPGGLTGSDGGPESREGAGCGAWRSACWGWGRSVRAWPGCSTGTRTGSRSGRGVGSRSNARWSAIGAGSATSRSLPRRSSRTLGECSTTPRSPSSWS